MPGISFLFKKGFHPATLENQKKVFIAQQSFNEIKKIEEERSKEVKNELETLQYKLENSSSVDPRHSSLKFMYSQPIIKKENEKSSNDKIGKHYEPKVGNDGDDEMVRLFRQKISKNEQTKISTDDTPTPVANIANSKLNEDKVKYNKSFGYSDQRSKLEIQTGKRSTVGQTAEEQETRFAFLKNAPLEGAFAKNMHVNHKPFNEVIRNVQCVRCGEWGHRSGERECVLRDHNPHDFARRKREDPMTYMQSTDFLVEKQKMILRHASSGYGADLAEGADAADLDSDPEAEYIASLTPREKKLLLRKLKQLEEGSTEPVSPLSSPTESSEEDERPKKKKKRKTS